MSEIKKNYLYQIVYQVFSFFSTILLTPYLSRVLGVAGTGINSYVTANVSYFVLLGNLGLFGYGQREVAYHRLDKQKVSLLFWELEALHIICFIFVSIAYGVLVIFSTKYRIYYLINYLTIFASLVEINWFFQAFEKFDLICKRNILIKIITIICVFLFVKEKDDLALYIFFVALGLFLGNSILWLNVRKYVDFVKFKDLKIKRHFKETLVYFLPTIAGSVYSLLDKSVINWITKSEEENGYYEQAYKILMIMNVIIQSFSTVMAPSMIFLFSQNKLEEMKDKLNKSLQFMLLISVGCAFGMISIVDRFVPVFFGPGYEPVNGLIIIFMPLVVILGFSVYLDGLYLVPAGKRKQSAYAVCVGAGSNLILNTILVYFFKSYGAAFATLLTEVIVTSIMIVLSRKMVCWKNLIKALIRYSLCGVAMLCLVKLIGVVMIGYNYIISMGIQIIFGIIIYLFCLLLLKDDFIYGVFKRKGRI